MRGDKKIPWEEMKHRRFPFTEWRSKKPHALSVSWFLRGCTSLPKWDLPLIRSPETTRGTWVENETSCLTGWLCEQWTLPSGTSVLRPPKGTVNSEQSHKQSSRLQVAGMVAHSFNPSTQEAEVDWFLWVWRQPGLQSLTKARVM